MNLLKKLFVLVLVSVFVQANAQEEGFSFNIDEIDIPYEKFVLDNGLTLIVHEDKKAPIVAVNVWYHVGSKNEPFGKTGFAHLFEHLMFNGSENFNTDYFQAMESIGATDLNGTTNNDRTNYFQNVPKSAFDIALWMESDRMGHFAGAISQERLDEQRGVVQNEKRQGENQPYGQAFTLIAENTYPASHPYQHSVIGSMADLDAASLEDVKGWFKDYYGPANAVIAIAGDIDTKEAYDKVVKYFGHIPSGPPVTKYDVNIAKRSGTTRQTQLDRVPQERVYMVWNVPEWGHRDAFNLDFVSAALTQGKNSRLYKRLVYEEQIATMVNSFNWEKEIGGSFVIMADAKPGVDISEIESIIDEELQKLLQTGPTEKELNRIKTQYFAQFVRGIERIGGFGGKSDILAMNQVYGGSPDFYKVRMKGMRDATVSGVKKAANMWLSDGKYVLTIKPFPEYSTVASDVDRSKGLPALGDPAPIKFPDLQKTTLSNGLKVVLAQRETVPVVRMSLMVDAGYAADQGAKAGTASLALDMMDEGTKNRSSLQINEDLAMLGATLNTGSNLDMSTVTMTALKQNLDASLELFNDVILNPAFPESDFDRLKKEQMVRIQREKRNPIQMALRVFPKFMYGEGHAYSNPFTGSGYEETVSQISRDDLVDFYSTWFKPNNATIAVVGDITMEDLTAKLEKGFKKWKQGDVPQKNLADVEPAKNRIYLMDRPGAIQSVIIAGHVTVPSGTKDEIAIEMMNKILGGDFTSRVNMNLREEKGWSYGSRTILIGARGQRPYIAYAPVQSDKTSESMVEVNKELREYLSSRPATTEEFEKSKKDRVLSLPGQWETNAAVAGSISNMVRYGYSDDYYKQYADNVRNLSLNDIHKAAKVALSPDDFSWIVVGDREKVEAKIKALGYGDVVIIDADGKVIEPAEQKVNLEGGGN